ncbi:Protein Rex [Bienertia sinuspersici]
MVMDSTLNRERAKTCGFHFQGTQSRAKQRSIYHTRASMSPVPTHWDPKHTDLRDAFHTVHCRHFNLALDSSRLLVIDYRSALQVQRFPHKAKDPAWERTVVTMAVEVYPAQLIRTTRQRHLGMGRKVDRQPTELGNAGFRHEDECSSQQRTSIYRRLKSRSALALAKYFLPCAYRLESIDPASLRDLSLRPCANTLLESSDSSPFGSTLRACLIMKSFESIGGGCGGNPAASSRAGPSSRVIRLTLATIATSLSTLAEKYSPSTSPFPYAQKLARPVYEPLYDSLTQSHDKQA